jgi:formyl-CoA transferase/CoA:oxalate CoA-transferase
MILADLGARVVKVEHPGKGDDTRHWGPPFIGAESAYFLSINRNKESVTLDFKPAEGRAVMEKLIAQADVLVENFRPGTLDRAGFGYEAVSQRHPRVIYASISGYGQTGPRREEAGYDAVMQAEGGLMSVTGDPDRPGVRMGVAITDMVAGLYCAQGISAALFARERSGHGQRVDIGMLDTTAALLTYQAGNFFATGNVPQRKGNQHATIAPYEVFSTIDGEIVVAVGNDGIWRRFCGAIGLPEMAADPRFATNKDRIANYPEMRPPIDRAFRTATSAEWIARLNAAGVANGEVRNIEQMLHDPQLEARNMIETVAHPTVGATRVIGAPIKLSENPASIRIPPPVLGEHTDAVLGEIGYDAAGISALRSKGVI